MSEVSRRGLLGLMAAAPVAATVAPFAARPVFARGGYIGGLVTADLTWTQTEAVKLSEVYRFDPPLRLPAPTDPEAIKRLHAIAAKMNRPPVPLKAADAGAGAPTMPHGAPVPDLHCNGYLDCTLKQTCASCVGIREMFSILRDARAC